ncbi:MAG: EamA family transporter [Pseudomonadota bacterium]
MRAEPTGIDLPCDAPFTVLAWCAQHPVKWRILRVRLPRALTVANLLLYIVTVLIWGTTWYVIKLQLGPVPESWSVAWRFFIAAAAMAVWLMARGRFKDLPTGRDLAFVCAQGAMLFSLNYWLFYIASNHLTTGLVAIIFSLITLMNIANQAVFFRQAVDRRTLMASLTGIVGLVLVFWPEFRHMAPGSSLVFAVGIGVLATYFASLGNILSVRNTRNGLPVLRTNMVGMFAGAVCMSLIAIGSGHPPAIELTPTYLGALFYLAVFGSVAAFGCYLTLIHRIGADKGAYAGVAFPVVALLISTWLEGYRWTPIAGLGVAMIVCGNVLALSKPAATRARSA